MADPSARISEVHPRGLFRSESLGPALAVYLPATAASRVIGLARNIALAWFISKAEYGLLLLTLLVINVLTPICSLGINEAVARYVPLFETRGALWAYLRRAAVLLGGVSIVACALLALTADPVGIGLFHTLDVNAGAGDGSASGSAAAVRIVGLTRWVALTLLALGPYFFVLATLRGLRMLRAMGLMELGCAAWFSILALGVAALGAATAGVVIVCYAIALATAVLVVGGAMVRALRRWSAQRQPLPVGEAVVRRMLKFSVWAAAASVMWQALQSYQTWYLNKIHGQEAIAVFGAARSVTQMIVVLAVAIVTVTTTIITRTWEAQGRDAADRQFHVAFKATGLLLLIVSAVLVSLRSAAMRLFPVSYAPGAVVFAPMLLFFLLASYLIFLSVHFNLIEKTRLLFVVWGLGLAANVAMARWWVRPAAPGQALTLAAQLLPAAWTAAAAMGVALLLCLILLRTERRPVDRGSWLVVVVAATLCLPWPVFVLVTMALVMLARPLLFSAEEMAWLRAQAIGVASAFRRHSQTM